ncbi:unnamed protein product [Cutaneotrichosporon oleaginosum]
MPSASASSFNPILLRLRKSSTSAHFGALLACISALPVHIFIFLLAQSAQSHLPAHAKPGCSRLSSSTLSRNHWAPSQPGVTSDKPLRATGDRRPDAEGSSAIAFSHFKLSRQFDNRLWPDSPSRCSHGHSPHCPFTARELAHDAVL